ncbi:hypothetical protein Pcac1_g237 [Phytophthora cactorum]|nr:hypothetical protein Pcac1_g237 [Phytophthora cactorum]KAG4048997.1 hypothetical protein PC123_g15709 [Phytophthora cactorum]
MRAGMRERGGKQADEPQPSAAQELVPTGHEAHEKMQASAE